MAAKSNTQLEEEVDELSNKLENTDEGDLDEYLRQIMDQEDYASHSLSQPPLIDQILKAMEFNIRMKLRDITVLSRKLLQRDLDGPTCDTLWEYRRILGKFNLFKKSTRLDIAYIVHQCGRFPGNPISIHKNAILTIGRYLMKTSDRGMVLRPVHQDYKEV